MVAVKLIVVLYFLLWYVLMAVLLYGWRKAASAWAMHVEPSVIPSVSVVIPLRNEAAHLPDLLRDLEGQELLPHEIIFVDDHSTDASAALCRQFASTRPGVYLLQLPTDCEGKKAALQAGITAATGEIIVTTDADCRLPATWLRTLVTCFQHPTTQLAAGTVVFSCSSVLSRFMALEQLALQAAAAASFYYQVPVFCSGANMAFRKKAFVEAGGYVHTLHLPSGDDVFLMRRIKALYPQGLVFCAAPGATVTTPAPQTVADLFRQRIRWAGKWKMLGPATAALAAFVFTFQLVVLALPALAMNWVITLPTFFVLVLTKWLTEALLLHRVARHLGTSFSGAYFLLAQVLFPPYVLLTGILAFRKKTLWKGRIIRTR